MRSNGTANCLTLDRFPSAVAFPFFFWLASAFCLFSVVFFLKKIFYSSRPTRRSTRFLFHYLRNSDFKPHSGFRFVSCTSPTIRRRPTRWINRTLLADVVMVTSEPENGGLFKSERETCRRRRRRRRRRWRRRRRRKALEIQLCMNAPAQDRFITADWTRPTRRPRLVLGAKPRGSQDHAETERRNIPRWRKC